MNMTDMQRGLIKFTGVQQARPPPKQSVNHVVITRSDRDQPENEIAIPKH